MQLPSRSILPRRVTRRQNSSQLIYLTFRSQTFYLTTPHPNHPTRQRFYTACKMIGNPFGPFFLARSSSFKEAIHIQWLLLRSDTNGSLLDPQPRRQGIRKSDATTHSFCQNFQSPAVKHLSVRIITILLYKC